MKSLKKIGAVLISVVLVIVCLSGCSRRDPVAEYRYDINVKVEEIVSMGEIVTTTVANLLNAMNAGDITKYETILGQVEELSASLIEKYKYIADYNAPEELVVRQIDLKTYESKIETLINDTVELYQLNAKFMNGELSDSMMNRMVELQNEIDSLQDAIDMFDKILNEMLGLNDQAQPEQGK